MVSWFYRKNGGSSRTGVPDQQSESPSFGKGISVLQTEEPGRAALLALWTGASTLHEASKRSAWLLLVVGFGVDSLEGEGVASRRN